MNLSGYFRVFCQKSVATRRDQLIWMWIAIFISQTRKYRATNIVPVADTGKFQRESWKRV